MSDRRHPDHTHSAQAWSDRTQRIPRPYSQRTDPACSGHSYHQPTQYPGWPADPNATNPTDRLPQYWQQGTPPSDQSTDESTAGRRKAPRWLWIAAAAAVLVVAALVIALVIATGTATRQTAVPAIPAIPSSPGPASSTSTSVPPSAGTSEPSTTESSPPAGGAAMQAVFYNVTGEGRAISITYVDNDGMMQTEFNVPLPWSKQVNMATTDDRTPNVTIVNVGHDVTCSVTVDGVQINERTGVGLTVCTGSG